MRSRSSSAAGRFSTSEPLSELRPKTQRLSKAPQALRVLPDEAGDAAPVPERSPGEETAVGLPPGGSGSRPPRDVPAFPVRAAGPVGEVDVVAVEAIALVQAAQLSSSSRRRKRKAPSSQSDCVGHGRPLVERGSGAAAGCSVSSSRRSGVRRTSVPRTVGKLRRDGCQRPSG